MEPTDKLLLIQLIDNNQAAFDELFRKYYRSLVLFALKITKNVEDAEEVVQDLFVILWEKRHHLEPIVSLKAYLYKSVFNNSVHLYKKSIKQGKTNLTEATVIEENFDNLLEQTELEERIIQSIEQLPAECRKIFKMSRFDELKNREIAEQLNISVKTVETQMTRALRYLRKHLDDYIKILIMIWIGK
ncbi:MAG: RNA polymerase sigma-70 factor [Bacteroidales bacterium]